MNVWEPLGIAYIVSYCKAHNDFIDFRFFSENFDKKSDILKEASTSDIVAFSCTTPTYYRSLRLAGEIKSLSSRVRVVVGGWHPTSVRKKEHSVIDTIIVGEGEVAFSDLININYKEFPEIITGTPLEFDKLPWPDRSFIRNQRYLSLCEKMCGERIASFQSVRGCRFNCSICSEYSMTGGCGIRVRDSIDLLTEVKYVHKAYSISSFKFVDPTWSISKDKIEKFCKEKIKRRVSLPWEAMVHASTLTKSLMKLMKEANCKCIAVGCESGSQDVLDEIRKKTTVSKIEKVFKWAKEIKLHNRAFFIIGLPNETIETINDSIRLIERITPDLAGFTILCPYPGSDYYSNEFRDVDWENADEYSNDFWYTEAFSNSDLKRIQSELVEKFKEKIVHRERHNKVIENEKSNSN